jgi:hypothetical protein
VVLNAESGSSAFDVAPTDAFEFVRLKTSAINCSRLRASTFDCWRGMTEGVAPAVLGAQGKEGHYGLRGMSERANISGGRLAMWSEPNDGTEVELRVPAKAA